MVLSVSQKKPLWLVPVGILCCLLLTFSWIGCSGSEDGSLVESDAVFAGSGPIKIVCTTGMVADMVAAVGGEHVEVTRMMGEGVDPHVYEPTLADNTSLRRSDMVFYNGLHLEPGMHDVFVVMSKKKPIYAVGDYLKASVSEKLIDTEGEYFDPHVWFDPELWAACVPGVVASLSKFDSKHANDYKKNGDEYQSKIQELTAYGRTKIAGLSEPRFLVTAHDAFSYFGRAFDIKVEAIQGISTQSEASTNRLNDLVGLIVENKVKAVFAESSINSKTIKALIEGCENQKHQVKLGGELYSDALGPEDSDAGEYLGMVRHNIDTIVEALK